MRIREWPADESDVRVTPDVSVDGVVEFVAVANHRMRIPRVDKQSLGAVDFLEAVGKVTDVPHRGDLVVDFLEGVRTLASHERNLNFRLLDELHETRDPDIRLKDLRSPSSFGRVFRCKTDCPKKTHHDMICPDVFRTTIDHLEDLVVKLPDVFHQVDDGVPSIEIFKVGLLFGVESESNDVDDVINLFRPQGSWRNNDGCVNCVVWRELVCFSIISIVVTRVPAKFLEKFGLVVMTISRNVDGFPLCEKFPQTFDRCRTMIHSDQRVVRRDAGPGPWAFVKMISQRPLRELVSSSDGFFVNIADLDGIGDGFPFHVFRP